MVASEKPTAYYDKLGFSSYPRDNKQLPPLLQTCLESENIVLNDVVKMYPKYLENILLVTGPVPSSELLQKYLYALFINETIDFTDQERKKLKMTESTKHEALITTHLQSYLDYTLNREKLFEQCQLDIYNKQCAVITAQYEASGDTNVETALAEYHRNFIKNNCYINIGQLMKKIMKQIAGDMNSSMFEKGQYQQCARNMFSPELHDNAPYLVISLS